MIEEFKEYLKIDKLSLDDELVQQPELFYQISESYVAAVSKRDAAYDEVKRVDADLDLQFREEAANEGLKTTEAQIKSKVLGHVEHIDAYNDYLKLKAEADALAALKEAFQMRSYALRELVELHVSGYYSSGGSVTVPETTYKENRAKIRDAYKGRGRKRKRKSLED